MSRMVAQQTIPQQAMARPAIPGRTAAPRTPLRDADRPSTLDRVSGKIILGLLVLMIGLSLAGAGGVFLLKPATAHTGQGSDVVRPIANYAPLPVMSFTLSDGDRLRELRVRVVLEMDPHTVPKVVESFGPRIANAMNGLMMDVTPADLRGQDGSYVIKDAVMRAAAKELRPMKVRQVLVQELILR
jgi:Flagellar basal body-associated protein FliL.